MTIMKCTVGQKTSPTFSVVTWRTIRFFYKFWYDYFWQRYSYRRRV